MDCVTVQPLQPVTGQQLEEVKSLTDRPSQLTRELQDLPRRRKRLLSRQKYRLLTCEDRDKDNMRLRTLRDNREKTWTSDAQNRR
jgi:hypothetical protein